MSCEKPGEGEKAIRGYQRSIPVIVALSRYYEHNNTYPLLLQDLVPDYIDAKYLETPAPPQEQYPFEYRPVDNETAYELSFRYVGPGMNQCTFHSKTYDWKCHGYY